MTLKLLFSILALVLLTGTVTAQEVNDDYRPKGKDLTWGAEAGGLRMAVWTNPATGTIFGAVRNFSSKKICYCLPHENNYTVYRVYARKNAASPEEWQKLQFKTPPPDGVWVADCLVVNLRQGEEMPVYVLQNGKRKKKNYSFFLDLNKYNFPAEMGDTVEIKLVQFNVYCHKTENKMGEVESPVFKIKLPFPALHKN